MLRNTCVRASRHACGRAGVLRACSERDMRVLCAVSVACVVEAPTSTQEDRRLVRRRRVRRTRGLFASTQARGMRHEAAQSGRELQLWCNSFLQQLSCMFTFFFCKSGEVLRTPSYHRRANLTCDSASPCAYVRPSVDEASFSTLLPPPPLLPIFNF